jgi:cytoskeleton protein RodZ
MFEIGSSLREARMRQELELSEAERDTRIRVKYLRALEDERFDVLPGAAYTKGFLRTYAQYLDLDGQRFVDEYNARFAPEEEPAAPRPVRIRRRRLALSPLLFALGLLAASIALLAWRLSSSTGNHPLKPPPAQTRKTAPAAPPPRHTATRAARFARVVLVASRGPCWLSVHLGSATGRLVFERTLEQGRTARFVSPRLWIRFGAPWNLDATVNGKTAELPAATGNVVITQAGLNPTTG